jgi:hypothetical protein
MMSRYLIDARIADPFVTVHIWAESEAQAQERFRSLAGEIMEQLSYVGGRTRSMKPNDEWITFEVSGFDEPDNIEIES